MADPFLESILDLKGANTLTVFPILLLTFTLQGEGVTLRFFVEGDAPVLVGSSSTAICWRCCRCASHC